MASNIDRTKLIAAGVVAVAADIMQWVLLPLGTWAGIADPVAVDQILDITVAGIMVSLLGFHWVFVPTAVGKLVPFVDMMPFWTGAVFFVAMGGKSSPTQLENPAGQPVLPDLHSQPHVPAVSNIQHGNP